MIKNDSLFVVSNINMKRARDLTWNRCPVPGTSHQALTVDGTKPKLTAHPEIATISLPVGFETKTFLRGGECYKVLNITPGQSRTGERER